MSSLEKEIQELKSMVLDMKKGIANTLEAQNNVINDIHLEVKGLQSDVKGLQDDVKEIKETQVQHGKRLGSIEDSMEFLKEKVFEHEEDIFHLKRSV